MNSREKIFKLIDNYKAHPCLWDRTDAAFKSFNSKQLAWNAIAKALNYDDASEVRKKMNSVLTSFRRERKVNNSTWFAYNRLSFLLPKFLTNENLNGKYEQYDTSWMQDSTTQQHSILSNETLDSDGESNDDVTHCDEEATNTTATTTTAKNFELLIPKIETITSPPTSPSLSLSQSVSPALNATCTRSKRKAIESMEQLESESATTTTTTTTVAIAKRQSAITNLNKSVHATPTKSMLAAITVNDISPITENASVNGIMPVLQQQQKQQQSLHTTTTTTSRDDVDIYTAYLDSKLRQYTKHTRNIVQYRINSILFEADMGKFDNVNGTTTNGHC